MSQKKKNPVATVCSLLGTILLIVLILGCIPLTVPKAFGYNIYTVISGSMEPAIPVGSHVYVKYQEPETIQKKDFIPTIYITAYSDELTIQRAIKTNPMGYILKPFRKDDIKSALLLTIYKLQNEKIEKNSSFIKLNDGYFYDLKNETLYYNTKPIKLSIKERQLLTILVEAKGNIVSFSDLEYLLWPDAPVSNSSLRTLVYRLRTKLEYKCIETISSIGCKILNSS